uniref:START domain-containing protein n=1 Tax=Steinernema glaseri TaxID=37863 RepID=A0A1I7Z569_9BILA
MSKGEWKIAAKSAEGRIESLIRSDCWEMCKKSKDCTIYRLQCEITDNTIFRFQATVPNCSVEDVCLRIHPCGTMRPVWDSQLQSIELVDELSEDTLVIRHVTKARLLGIISERDTIDLCKFTTAEDGSRRVVMTSIVHPEAPREPSIVRAHTHPSVFIIRATHDNNVEVEAILHAEMHLNSVPTKVLETLVPRGIVKFHDDLKKSFQKSQHPPKVNRPLPGWIAVRSADRA